MGFRPSRSTTDDQLVAACQAGSGDAFQELYERHQPVVYRACLARLRCPDDANDATQEAFARGLRELQGLQDGDHFVRWIHTVARRICVDTLRDRARRAEPAGENHVHDDRDPAEMATTSIVLSDALASIPDRDRQALMLRDLAGTPVPEVAALFGLTQGSTRVMLHRARMRLREAVGSGGLGALVPWMLRPLRRLGVVSTVGNRGVLASPGLLGASLTALGVVAVTIAVLMPAMPTGPDPIGTEGADYALLLSTSHRPAVGLTSDEMPGSHLPARRSDPLGDGDGPAIGAHVDPATVEVSREAPDEAPDLYYVVHEPVTGGEVRIGVWDPPVPPPCMDVAVLQCEAPDER